MLVISFLEFNESHRKLSANRLLQNRKQTIHCILKLFIPTDLSKLAACARGYIVPSIVIQQSPLNDRSLFNNNIHVGRPIQISFKEKKIILFDVNILQLSFVAELTVMLNYNHAQRSSRLQSSYFIRFFLLMVLLSCVNWRCRFC